MSAATDRLVLLSLAGYFKAVGLRAERQAEGAVTDRMRNAYVHESRAADNLAQTLLAAADDMLAEQRDLFRLAGGR